MGLLQQQEKQRMLEGYREGFVGWLFGENGQLLPRQHVVWLAFQGSHWWWVWCAAETCLGENRLGKRSLWGTPRWLGGVAEKEIRWAQKFPPWIGWSWVTEESLADSMGSG